jgi:hypothetical protein
MINWEKRRKKISSYASIAVMCAAAIVTFLTMQPANAEEEASKLASGLPPGIVWFSKSGLDTQNNNIDGLIADLGQTCNRSLFKPGQCTIEKELRRFLASLPPEYVAIERELRSRGAVCRGKNNDLNCIFEKRVKAKTMKGVVASAEYDDFFRIHLRITGHAPVLQYTADVQFKSTQTR